MGFIGARAVRFEQMVEKANLLVESVATGSTSEQTRSGGSSLREVGHQKCSLVKL